MWEVYVRARIKSLEPIVSYPANVGWRSAKVLPKTDGLVLNYVCRPSGSMSPYLTPSTAIRSEFNSPFKAVTFDGAHAIAM